MDGLKLFFKESLKKIKPVPLGPLKYFLPEPTKTSHLILFTSIFTCPTDWHASTKYIILEFIVLTNLPIF